MQISRRLAVANTKRIMYEWPNRWVLWLTETIDRGVDTACGCNYHALCLWLFLVAPGCSGFILFARASSFGMVVGRFARQLRSVNVLAMPDAGMDTTRPVESVCMVLLGTGVLRLHVSGVAVGVFIDCRCDADWVEFTRWVISATWELFSEDKGVEFWPWIVAGYGTPSLRAICLASWYGNAFLSWQKLRIPCWLTLLLILTISKTANILCDRSWFRVRAVGRHIPI